MYIYECNHGGLYAKDHPKPNGLDILLGEANDRQQALDLLRGSVTEIIYGKKWVKEWVESHYAE